MWPGNIQINDFYLKKKDKCTTLWYFNTFFSIIYRSSKLKYNNNLEDFEQHKKVWADKNL